MSFLEKKDINVYVGAKKDVSLHRF